MLPAPMYCRVLCVCFDGGGIVVLWYCGSGILCDSVSVRVRGVGGKLVISSSTQSTSNTYIWFDRRISRSQEYTIHSTRSFNRDPTPDRERIEAYFNRCVHCPPNVPH